MAPGNRRQDPLLSFRFHIEVDGNYIGSASEVSGLEVEYEVLEYPEGGQNDFVHKLPGRRKYANIVVKGALIYDGPSTLAWLMTGGVGKSYSSLWTNMTIQSRKENNHDIGRSWHITNAYPVKWSGPQFQSDSNAVAIEMLEIAHQGFQEA